MMNKNFLAGLAVGLFKRVYYITKMPVFSAFPSFNYIRLYWIYPLDNSVASVKIVRKLGSYPTALNDGTLVYSGSDISYNDIDVSKGTTYYYRLFPVDADGNLIDSQDVVSATVSTVARYKLYFDGKTSKVTVGYNDTLYKLFVTGNYSIIVKFKKYSDTSQDGYNDPSEIIALWYSSGEIESHNAFILYSTAYYVENDHIAFAFQNNTDLVWSVVADNSLEDHKLSISNNGSEFQSKTNMISGIGISSYPLMLGSAWNNRYHFYGTIQEVQIWDYTLSAEKDLFYSQNSPIGNEEGLLVYYDMSEGSGNILHNKGSLGTSCNGTIGNVVKYSIIPPSDGYPYFIIYPYDSSTYEMITSTNKFYNNGTNITSGENVCKAYLYNASKDSWDPYWSGGSANIPNSTSLSYANHDVLNINSTMFFKGKVDTNTWQGTAIDKTTCEYMRTKSCNYLASKTCQQIKDGDY